MKLLQVDSDVSRTKQQILFCLIIREDGVTISRAEGIQLSTLASNVTDIVLHDSTFVNLMDIILNLDILFENKYSEKFIAIVIDAIEKDSMGLEFLTEISLLSYYL